MYKARTHGKFTGLSGTEYRFFKGQTVDAPNGDLYFCSGVVWKGKQPEKKPPQIEPSVETIYPEGYSKNVNSS